MKLTMKMIALCAIIVLVLTPSLHVANAQTAELLWCITSLATGGDPDACCTADIIDEATDLIGIPVVGEVINILTSLCCVGNIFELEVSCCVEALIGVTGSPLIETCCGADVFLQNEVQCCAAITDYDLCLCDDSDIISQNPDICCITESFSEEQYQNCCALDTYNDITRTECCNNEPTFGEGTTVQNCCDTPARIEENNLCCGIEAFPEAQVADFVEICCAAAADVAANPACCNTDTFNQLQRESCCNENNYEEQIEKCCPAGVDNLPDYCEDEPEPPGPEPPGPKPPKPKPKPPHKKHRLSKVVNHQQLDVKTVVNVPFEVRL